MHLPRPHLILLLPATLITCWLGMMLTHESGHILATLATTLLLTLSLLLGP